MRVPDSELITPLVELTDRDEVAADLGDKEDVVEGDHLEFVSGNSSPEVDLADSSGDDVSSNFPNLFGLAGNKVGEVVLLPQHGSSAHQDSAPADAPRPQLVGQSH